MTRTKITKTAALLALSWLMAAPAQAEIIWNEPTVAPTGEPSARQYEVTNGNFEGGMTLPAPDIRKLQKSLAAKGFYKGNIDGLWGGGTTQAILDYQAVNNMPLTGKLTAEELKRFDIFVPR